MNFIVARLGIIISIISLSCTATASFAADSTQYLDGIEVKDIALDGDTIWCATSEHGIVELDKTTGEYTHHMPFPDKISNYWSVAVDHNGIVWAGGGDGIIRYNGTEWIYCNDETEQLSTIGDPIFALDIAVDKNNIKYYATNNGLFYYNDIDWIRIGDDRYWWEEIAIDERTNTVWFQTADMIAQYHDNQLYYIDLIGLDALKNEYMLEIVVDSDSNIWIGGNEFISHFNNTSWNTVYNKNMSYVVSLAFRQDGTLWIGTGVGLVSYDFISFTSHEIILDNNNLVAGVYNIEMDADNTMWIAFGLGLLHYYPDLPTYAEKPRPLAPSIRNTPNPFNPSTTISFTLPESGHASLTVYNLAGQVVRPLVEGQYSAGTHRIVWDGLDNDGNAVAAGVYVTRLTAEGTVATGKMVLVK